jgi:hypothetical protein
MYSKKREGNYDHESTRVTGCVGDIVGVLEARSSEIICIRVFVFCHQTKNSRSGIPVITYCEPSRTAKLFNVTVPETCVLEYVQLWRVTWKQGNLQFLTIN